MGVFVSAVGASFGDLTVLERAETSTSGKTRYLCQCACGGQIVAQQGNLKSGTTTHCGCRLKRLTAEGTAAWLATYQIRTRDKRLAQMKARYWVNRDVMRAQQAEYREAHRGQIVEMNRAYYQNNKDKHLVHSQARRARKAGATVELVERDVVWERDAGICHICSLPADPENWHLEHIIPLVRGGEHSYANTAVSHPTCNKRKGVSLLCMDQVI